MKNILVIDGDKFLVNRLVGFIQSFLGPEYHAQGATTIESGWKLLKNPTLVVAEVTREWYSELCEVFDKFSEIEEKLILTSGTYFSLCEIKKKLPWVYCLRKPIDATLFERAIKAKIALKEKT